MFRGRPGEPTFRERVDVIGNKAFIEFVEQLEKDEEIEFETVDLGVDRVVIEKLRLREAGAGHLHPCAQPGPGA
jgi:hypothetical protein